MNQAFNAPLLLTARKSAGLSQADLADMTNISQGMLSKIERELNEPNDAMVDALAKALGVTSKFFYEAPHLTTAPITLFRKTNLSKKVLAKTEADLNIVSMNINTLLSGVDFQPSISLPECEHGEFSPTQVARLLRSSWSMPLGPVEDVTAYIEACGIVVVPMDLPNKIDAVFLSTGWDNPIFCINTNAPGDRLRFSLCHELGHYVLGHNAVFANQYDLEAEANEFASEFLMPTEQIRPYLHGINLVKAQELKARWKVSIQSLIYKAATVGAITESRKKSLFCHISQKGWRKNEPVFVAREEPEILKEIVQHHLDIGYTLEQLAQMLRLSESKFRYLFKHVIVAPAPKLHVLYQTTSKAPPNPLDKSNKKTSASKQ